METITQSVEMKQPISFVDGNAMYSVASGVIHAIDKWDDISPDVLTTKSISTSQGITSITPTSRVASPGRFQFHLNNTAYNSASTAGYYSLNHSGKRDGFEQGVEIRLKRVYSGDTGYHWRGRIYDITPEASPYQSYTSVVAYDWMMEAQEQKFKAITTATNQRGDQAIETLLGIMPNAKKPSAYNLDTGKSTYPYVFDSERDEKSSVMSVLQKVAQTELGKIYVNHQDGDGENLVFENRHHGIDNTTVQYDFDDDVVSVDASYPFDLIKTKIICRAFPREVDTGDVVLAKIQKSFRIPKGETRTIKLQFRDPDSGERISASSLTTQVSGTDYVANAAEDGGGADKTAQVSVTVSEQSANAASYDITENGTGAVWITTFQQQGKGIYLYDPATYEAESNGTYIAEKGESILRYDLPYEDDYNVAIDFGDYLLSTWQDPICQVDRLTFYPEESAALASAFMDIDIGHRITVNLTQLGIDQDYFVRKIDTDWDRGLIRASYGVIPAGSSVYMQLNDSVYGKLDADECRLAF